MARVVLKHKKTYAPSEKESWVFIVPFLSEIEDSGFFKLFLFFVVV